MHVIQHHPPSPLMGERIYLSTQGVADYLDTSRKHIYTLVAAKKIPHTKLGGKLRFDRRRIDEWMAANAEEVSA